MENLIGPERNGRITAAVCHSKPQRRQTASAKTVFCGSLVTRRDRKQTSIQSRWQSAFAMTSDRYDAANPGGSRLAAVTTLKQRSSSTSWVQFPHRVRTDFALSGTNRTRAIAQISHRFFRLALLKSAH